jgi:hypothetical protein
MISLSHWGMFSDTLDDFTASYPVALDYLRKGELTESFDGEFIPDPDRECGLSAQGAASERQLRWASHPIGRV